MSGRLQIGILTCTISLLAFILYGFSSESTGEYEDYEEVDWIEIEESIQKKWEEEYIGFDNGAEMVPVQLEEMPKTFISDEVPLKGEWQDAIQILCDDYKISYPFILAMIEHESSFRPEVINSTGHVGLMQLQPKWFKDIMEELDITEDMLTNPYANVNVAVVYLSQLFEKYEEPSLVLMIYNMGEGRALELWKKGCVSKYAKTILKREQYWCEVVYGKEQ